MKFNEYTDTWFSKLVETADLKVAAMRQLHTLVATRYPEAKNLSLARKLATHIADAAIRRPLLAHIDALLAGQFRNEFKFKFHRYPKYAGRSSACGELFSMMRQALEYQNAVL